MWAGAAVPQRVRLADEPRLPRVRVGTPHAHPSPQPSIPAPLKQTLAPGYEKMPDYEQYMVQFLRTVASPRRSMRTVVADGPQRAAAEQHAEQAAAEAAPGQP